MKTRRDLARYFRSLGYTLGAEIGVADGINAMTFLEEIPDLHLHCIDPWEDHPSSYYNAVKRLPKQRVHIYKATSMESVFAFPDNALDFVFIDGDHRFDYVMEDIIAWSRKVKKGGAIALHDFYHFKNSGVFEAVTVYTSIHKINIHTTLGDKNSLDDKMSSVWWIK